MSLPRRIERWSLANALGMLGAAAVAGWTQSLWPLLVAGGGLLGGLVGVARGRWTPTGRFGAANAVTALRTAALALLPVGGGQPVWVGAVSAGFLLADGLDGWLARRARDASPFGAFFDKEADALFVLLLCMGAVQQGHVPIWGLWPGLLRYLFVVAVFGWDPPEKTETRSSAARFVYAATVGALLAAFVVPPALAPLLVALASGAITVSFARSAWQMRPRRPPRPGE